MQKTEKHCKNQCFCYHKTTKISPKTGPKTQKSASGPGHLRNRKKRCCKPKNWGQKVEKHGVFHFSLADFGRARSRTGVFRTVFYSVFWRRASRPIKNRRFYECHPEDHAPAPSVRADLIILRVCFTGLPPKGDVRMFGRKALARETPCFQFRVSQGFKNIWKSHVNY